MEILPQGPQEPDAGGFSSSLGVTCTDPGVPPDFDGDGFVGILDLLALLAEWGPCP